MGEYRAGQGRERLAEDHEDILGRRHYWNFRNTICVALRLSIIKQALLAVCGISPRLSGSDNTSFKVGNSQSEKKKTVPRSVRFRQLTNV